MKHLKKYSLLILFLGLISCNEYLDVVPDQRLEIDNLDKLEATLIGSYQNNRSYRFTHYSSDDVELAEEVFNSYPIIEDLFSWSRDFRNQRHQDSPSEFWLASYGAISQANLVLEKSTSIKTTNKEEEGRLKLIIAEAKLVRSYNHFMLVNIFAKHYDATSAKSDLGIPYTEKVEEKLITEYERISVEDVYNKAEKDLLDAISVIEKYSNSFKNNRYRFTLATMYAYASRFYNFRNKGTEDQDKVILYATKSLDNFQGANNMRSWDEYTSDANGPVNIERSDVGLVQSSYSWISINVNYQMTQNINNVLRANPFGNTDFRLNINYSRDGNIFMPAFFFNFTSESGLLATDNFPLVEVILNKAEAHIRKDEFTQAADLLKIVGEKCYRGYNPNLLTSAFLKNFYGSSTDKGAWTSYLLHERRLSLMYKGFRWFDLKRYNIDITHKLEDGTEIKLSDIAPNRDYQIPKYAISNGMTPNN